MPQATVVRDRTLGFVSDLSAVGFTKSVILSRLEIDWSLQAGLPRLGDPYGGPRPEPPVAPTLAEVSIWLRTD